ncbi:WXG100 family type VII secretion target [Streptomyces sp. MBT53]|uniref:WXG100 family type VII secretion target n=1 Tax=Streptomyces sp. MBT53 TaxID=1488384 RepID=UPI001912645C|nr:WXG100 family type VII secretion target [Streptomyces sp. MBT53]MBK6014467.1 WXG100 family type VII secretion target [Streptomyces sp. MBT53]
MPDYNSGGFHQGEDGTIFGNPDGTNSGSVTDYENWDWKQIKAAVYGMSSGVGTEANLAHARSIANPQSLMDAANAFLDIQRILEAVTKSLVDQAKALAGDNGPWGGSAADAFLTMMTNFSRQVKANADVLAGGSTGDHSIPHQLANNAISFQSAQNKLAEIDVWYAHQAVLMGVTPMSDGLIPISQKPELVAMMTDDMRAVLKNLAHSYQVTSDAVVNPTPVTSPTNNPDGSGNDGNGPDLNTGGLDDLGAGTGDTGSLSDLSGFPDTGLDGGTGTGDGIGGLGDVAGLDASGDPTAYPGDLSGLGDTGLDGTGLGDLGLDGLDPAGIDSALNPVSFPGLAGLGGLGSLAGLGGSDLGSEGESSLGGLSSADPAAFGDTGLGDGIADGLAGGLTDGLDSGLTDGLSTGSPAQLATSSGMPYMPGMGGTGASGAGLTSEPTDASGLLDASADPWEGEETPGGGEVGSELGAVAGGEGLSTSGMPYMPGMGGMGASNAGRDATNERTDASGLLDPSTAPWDGTQETGDDEVGSLTGALPGVPYLPGFDANGPAARTATARASATDGEGAGESAPAEEGAAAEGLAEEGATEGRTAPATAEATVAVGSDGLPLPAPDESGVVLHPLADDGEEDFSAWEPGAGAFVPVLWALRAEGERETGPEADGPGASGEPRSTWQPDRTGSGAPAGVSGAVLGTAYCGDGGPEPEEPEEEVEEEPEEEPAARGIADLLVQPESTWGAVPGDSAAAL